MNPWLRNFNQTVLLAGLAVLAASCFSTKPAHRSGMVMLTNRGWDSSKKDFVDIRMSPVKKVWYKDSLVIMPLVRTEQNTDIHRKTTIEHITEGYIFLDLRTRWFSEYAVFSDTSQPLKVYTQADTTLILGGWNFYGPRLWEVMEPLTDLPDTIISGIKYSRVSCQAKYPKDTLDMIAYLRYDRKGTLFHLHKDFIRLKGCPATRADWISTSRHPHGFSVTIDFTRDQLTAQEEKIFDAWERNTRNGMKRKVKA